ncbi:MAG: acyltransferase [Lachnospiraceae bacterium]|jgi:surface polysaccharide O-acyltransferase-like enzyme|nr:acyltransferase [Lachnospiraceae bacterium]
MGKERFPARRQANYELLRIIAMLMVVTLHYLNHTGMLLTAGGEGGTNRFLGMLAESFCIVAVNVYVLISGYFLVEAGFKVKRVLVLICQVFFYAAVIPLIMMGTGIFIKSGEGGYRALQYLLPLQTEHYWFASSYVFLYLFTPVLNTAVKAMSKRQIQITIAGLLLLFCGEKSIVPAPLAMDRFGYDFGWFLCVYLVAAYIRLYGCRWMEDARKAWGIYVGSALAIFAIGTGSYLIHIRTGRLTYYMDVPYHYNFILCLVGAVALFGAFGHIKIPEGKISEWICKLSPLTFGVYLFHEHIDIRNVWTGWVEDFIGPVAGAGIAGFLFHLVASVLIVYIAGSFIDAIRLNIFRFAGRYLAKWKGVAWINKLDKEFR